MPRSRRLLGLLLVVLVPVGLAAAPPGPALAEGPVPGPARGPDRVLPSQRLVEPGAPAPDGLRTPPRRIANYPASTQQPAPAEPQRGLLVGVSPTVDQQGLTAGSVSPSDSTGAIGPSHYIEVINSQIAIFDRTLVAPAQSVPLATFVAAPAGLNTGDPQIQWDMQGGRWLYSVLLYVYGANPPASSDFQIAFGWSKSSGDPSILTLGNTDWCNFSVDTGKDTWDYPKLGHDANYMMVGANVFPNAGSLFGDSRVMAMAKPAANDPSCTKPTATIFSLGQAFTPIPANTTDASGSGYIVAISPTDFGAWHISKTSIAGCSAGPPCLVFDGTIAIASWATAPAGRFLIPQPGGRADIDGLDGRITQVVQHSDPAARGVEGVWTQHTTGSPSGRTVVTWYELTPSLCSGGLCPPAAERQEGTLSSAALSLFNAAISPTSRGDGAVVHYNTGSATTFVDVRAQRRDGADPVNTMSGELTLAESTVADTDFTCTTQFGGPPCRWGDYAGASPDPIDPCTVWGTTTITGNVQATGSPARPTWVTQNFALTEGAVQSAVSTQQYVLAGSNGVAWADMDSSLLQLGSTRCSSSTAVITANADLFTSTAGVNQDIGIFVDTDGVASTQPIAWKESGGLNGTFSPNAAYVQSTLNVAGGHSYVVRLKWKANGATSGSIYAGAGPLPGGGYSPTRLTVQYHSTAPQSASMTAQQKLTMSDGVTWRAIPGIGPVTVTTSPTLGARVIFGGNADLWTDTAGINQDIGIQLTGGPLAAALIAWKESGGSNGTYSPNAAFVQAAFNLNPNTTYSAQLVWKANQAAPAGSSIYVGAGPLPGGAFSNTSLFAVVLPGGSNPYEAVVTTQPRMTGSDGVTWAAMSTALQLTFTPSASTYAVVGANADLWTGSAGYNQDLAVFMSVDGSPTLQRLVWKESGGFGGIQSPNAAFAEAVVSLTAGHTYLFSVMWKANQNAPGATIWAGAGPLPGTGAYSPTRLLLYVL